MDRKKIAVVGAGPGGLTAAMILSHQGYDVTVFEKKDVLGGRNSEIDISGFRFDVGPTFLMMKFILDEVFDQVGEKSDNHIKFTKLEPMYELMFRDKILSPTTDHQNMKRQIKEFFPGDEDGFDRFLEKEKKRYEKMYPCLQKDYSSLSAYARPIFIRALPYLGLTKKLFPHLKTYFKNDDLCLSFTFQSKYLGMSAWDCPKAFVMLSYVEHIWGVYHVEGGLSRISDAMAKVCRKKGANIMLNNAVKRLLVKDGACRGVELENGREFKADAVVLNADFAHAMSNMVDDGVLKKYSKEKLLGRDYSCSTFMLYLGLDKIYDSPHHRIVFSKDYKMNVDEIFKKNTLSEDPSFYVRNASKTDPKLAPKGKSAVYVLVPVPNLKARIDWEKIKSSYRDKIIGLIKERTEMADIEEHIEAEKIITPMDWEKEYNVFLGATFNLSHKLSQMLYLRPRNRFEEIRNVYLVGGGTHPGSGLPTIYESARISAGLIKEDLG